jgi:signal transduction histidine kinase
MAGAMYGQHVASFTARLPDTERGKLRADVALALAILAVGQLDVWATSFTGAHLTGPEPLAAVLYGVTAIALAWRRRHPVGVLLLIVGIDALHALAFGAPEGNAVFLPAIVALYSVGAHEPPGIALRAGLLAAMVLALREVRNPESTSFDAVLDAAAWDIAILGGTILGAYVRTRRLYLAELTDRAARAEREREERARAAVDEERSRIARELHDAVAHGSA